MADSFNEPNEIRWAVTRRILSRSGSYSNTKPLLVDAAVEFGIATREDFAQLSSTGLKVKSIEVSRGILVSVAYNLDGGGRVVYGSSPAVPHSTTSVGETCATIQGIIDHIASDQPFELQCCTDLGFHVFVGMDLLQIVANKGETGENIERISGILSQFASCHYSTMGLVENQEVFYFNHHLTRDEIHRACGLLLSEGAQLPDDAVVRVSYGHVSVTHY